MAPALPPPPTGRPVASGVVEGVPEGGVAGLVPGVVIARHASPRLLDSGVVSDPTGPRVISESIDVDAPPATVFSILSDPRQHARIDGSGSVRGHVRGPDRLAAKGDTFGMDMKLGASYSTRNEVVELDEDRRIAWRTLAPFPLNHLFTGRTWRYELEPVEGGTLVRETWDTDQEQHPWLVAGLAPLTRVSIRRTLERIAALVER